MTCADNFCGFLFIGSHFFSLLAVNVTCHLNSTIRDKKSDVSVPFFFVINSFCLEGYDVLFSFVFSWDLYTDIIFYKSILFKLF